MKIAPFLVSSLLAGAGAAGWMALYRYGEAEPPLASPREKGELVVLTVRGPTTYEPAPNGARSGFEHDLAREFARELGVKARFVTFENAEQAIAALERRRGHLVAAGLAPTRDTEMRVRFGPPFHSVTPYVVYRRKTARPWSAADLRGKRIGVIAGSDHAERLGDWRRDLPDLEWLEFSRGTTEDLLHRVAEGSLDATIADSHWIQLTRHMLPAVEVAFDVAPAKSLAWAFPLAGDDHIYNAARNFFTRTTQDGTLKRLIASYYDDARRLDRTDIAVFIERSENVLPRYRNLFHAAEEASGIDWRLIAAIGYQESRWEPAAKSFTGVRGLMMLTNDTAGRLRVKDRLDTRETIPAGARYLAMLKKNLSGPVPEPDRTWMAVAAYNQGLGHVEDARELTRRMKRNPDLWIDVKKALPLLSDRAHYETLPHGYARGDEALAMAENVRTYYDVLVRLHEPHRKNRPVKP